jgi:type IV secretory pathway TraG/TraD family ATPase VirD4
VLDEAANYPLPSLSSLMSEGGGTGICTAVVLQSLAQARDRWGGEAAQAIWDAATVKVVLGGQANADDLADLSRLLGDVEVTEASESWARGGERTVSVAPRQRPVLEPSRLRTLAFGTAVLLLRSTPPVLLDLEPWTARRDAKRLRTEREGIESALRLGAGGDGQNA